jgi:hypothetical protein
LSVAFHDTVLLIQQRRCTINLSFKVIELFDHSQ